MALSKQIVFVFRAITVGLAAAFVIVFLKPELLAPERPVVEVTQSAPAAADAATGAATALSFAGTVQRTSPTVVNIFTRKRVRSAANPLADDPFFRRFFGDAVRAPRERVENSLGSGVIVSPQGYILTNFHVIREADDVLVMLSDGRSGVATLVGGDAETDLAVLKVDVGELPSITLGNSEALRVGDLVLAIGNPFGVGQTVTMGIVSATGRNQLGINTFEDFIQTDAAINPGNSGGALINLAGELVGINTAIFSRSGGSQGIGFAIPATLASDVMRQIIEQGRVVRGWLGVEASDLTAELALQLGVERRDGVVITNLIQGGPAHRAGLQPGDILIAIDGTPLSTTREILDAVARRKPGSAARVTAIRAGRNLSTEVVVQERPQQRPN